MRFLARVTLGGAWMAIAGAVLVAVGAQPAVGSPDVAAVEGAGRPVAMVLVPDLTWLTAPSSLDQWAKANVAMRSAEPRSRAEDTYITLGKGNRSAALRDDAGVGRVEPTSDGGLRLTDWEALKERDAGLHFGGPLGSVGEALRDRGLRWAVAADDKDAAAVATTGDGIVPRAYPGTVEGIRSAVDAQLDALFVAVPHSRLPQVLDLLDPMCTLVVSASTPDENRHLGVLGASGSCGLGRAGLASPSTHHSHLVTLPDVSATFLTLAGAREPTSLGGAAVTPTGDVERSRLVERDRRAWTADRARTGFVWLFVVFHALGALAVTRTPKLRTVVCCVLLSLPAASFLMMLLPWWRAGAWAGLLVGGAFAALISFGGTLLARRDLVLGIGALAALTSAVVGLDALFASPLQIDAPFGNSPIGAGRFFGVGNIGSGFLVAGLLVAGGLAIERWGRSALRWVALAFAAGTVAGGAPQFGADVGGVLFAVPAYGVMLLGAMRLRITVRHVAVLGGAAVLAVALFAAVDLVREAGSQTHLAKGVAEQGLGDEVVRKATRAVKTVIMPMAILVVVAAAVWMSGRFSFGSRPALRAASSALLTAAVLGSLLNDSGLLVAAAVAAVAWPAGVALASDSRQTEGLPEGVA